MADRRKSNVVINHEEQYALWPADEAAPAGWQAVTPAGTDDDLLAYLRGISARTQDANLARFVEELAGGGGKGGFA
jgi:MbtH protein